MRRPRALLTYRLFHSDGGCLRGKLARICARRLKLAAAATIDAFPSRVVSHGGWRQGTGRPERLQRDEDTQSASVVHWKGSSRADLLTTPFDSGRGRVLWRLIHRAGIVEQYLFSPSHAGAGFGDAVAFSGVQGVDPSPPVRTSFLGHEGHWGEDVA